MAGGTIPTNFSGTVYRLHSRYEWVGPMYTELGQDPNFRASRSSSERSSTLLRSGPLPWFPPTRG